MDLSRTIATTAVVLGVILAAGYASGEAATPPAPNQTAQEKVAEREAQRRAAVEEHQKRKEAFERACHKPLKSESDIDSCRTAYKRLNNSGSGS